MNPIFLYHGQNQDDHDKKNYYICPPAEEEKDAAYGNQPEK